MKKWLKKQLPLVLLTIVFVLTIGLVLSTQSEQSEEIVLGGVAKQRYVADYEIENIVATNKLRDKAEEQVKDVYKPDISVDTRIMSGVDSLFEEFGKMRQNYIPIELPYEANTETTPGEMNTVKPPFSYELESDIKLTDTQLEYIATMPSDEFVALKESIVVFITAELENGINDDNTSLQRIMVTVKEELEEQELDEKEVKIAYEIILYYLEPNAFYDAEETLLKKEEARAAVPPIMVLKGEKIVGESERITEEAFAMLETLGYVDSGPEKTIIPMLGRSVLIFLIFILIGQYVRRFQKDILVNNKKVLLLFTLYTMSVIVSRFMINIEYMFIPIIAFTMLVAVLLDETMSIIFGMVITIVIGLMLDKEIDYYIYFFITAPLAGMMGKRISDRDGVFSVSALLSFLSMITCYSIEMILKKTFWSSTSSRILLIAFLMGVVTVVFVMGSTPYWESVFGIVSQNMLMNLSNPKNPLMRRMIIEAPGTYHHSLIVANLAETAAYDIGANSALARVGGYYQDIGKMQYPGYFTENQMGENPHDYLDAKASAKIIISHVENGEKLAREHKLPEEIIKMITEHHGNTLVKYFYHKAQEEADPDDPPDEKDFRYPYNPPSFRESGVIMLADTVEAAVRSMIPQGKTIDEVSDVVKALIKDKLDDNQLKNSGLTIQDLDTIHDSFMRVFKGMYQKRIPYPKGTTKALDELEEKKQQDEA